MPRFTRRELLKRAGMMSAAVAAVPGDAVASSEAASPALEVKAPLTASAAPEPLPNLTAAELDILEAIVARLIPSDAKGPGAAEARATHYIDRALGGALASSREAYAAGLAAVDRYARSSRGKAFTELLAADQESVLKDVETDAATGFTGSSAAFFTMVQAHTLQGTFCDPYYGGNASFVGWDMIGYPGVRTMVAPDQQRMGVEVPANHKSAYDYEMFTKASAKAPSQREARHGD